MRYLVFISFVLMWVSCSQNYDETYVSLEGYQIEDGFELEVIAAEPLLEAPVAIDFDSQGRIWVVQMPGYMNDLEGTDEDLPTGSIKILQDLDHDGVADHAQTFLDSLVMPRALAHVYGGLLYAEPPFLYFVDIENDQAKNRIVVDSIYAADGNPEHQPNGLLLNIDNWIYNAKSNFRYRRKNGKWLKEPTTFRGQWSISNDNFGRLYYNNNSQQLLGDHLLPNRTIRNKYFKPKKSVNQMLTKDQRVYPLQATTVNRGYAKGVLNADSMLVNTTAAAGLLVYRGGAFSTDYDQNVFVSIPEVNAIKRNVLNFDGIKTEAKQAYEGKEFLAALDEGFRPVSLNNGPDGSMYIVDMHRGVIGHHAYLSSYFRQKTLENRLDTLTDYGRILKVNKLGVSTNAVPDFDRLSAKELVGLLQHKNGWLRNRAQHYLIFKNKTEIIPDVKKLVLSNESEWTQIHGLYVLEGLGALDFYFLIALAEVNSSKVKVHVLVLLEQFASAANSQKVAELFGQLMAQNDSLLDVYIANTIGSWLQFDETLFTSIVLELLKRTGNNQIHYEALVSGLKGSETHILNSLKAIDSKEAKVLKTMLTQTLANQKSNKVNSIYTRAYLNEDNRTTGAKMYFQICASCHGNNGSGIEGLAPPLQGSEFVADGEKLGLIILHGLQGAITVKGETYDLNLAMPGLIRNASITDKDIADLIAYVTNAFSDEPYWFKKERVTELRELVPKSGAEYTEEELLQHSN